jgi:hypothetical protein
VNPACDRVRELAPELALGILDGAERGDLLEHLSHCPECRHYVDELATTADELVLLAPSAEPPLGFESRVLERIHPAQERPRRRWLPNWRLAVGALAAATAAAIGVWVATGPDREVADRYRDTLAVADGRYFTAVPLERDTGSRIGTVFGYAGDPSWCMVLIRPYEGARPVRSGVYEVELERTDGGRAAMGRLTVRNGSGSLGRALGFEYKELHEVRVLREDGSILASVAIRSAH